MPFGPPTPKQAAPAKARLATLSPDAMLDETLATIQKPFQRLEAVLHRLGYADPFGEQRYANMRRAMKAAGYSLDDVARLGVQGMGEVLEAYARTQDLIYASGDVKASALLRAKSGLKKPGPKKMDRRLEGRKLLATRKRRGLTQEKYEEESGMPLRKIQRLEAAAKAPPEDPKTRH